MFAPFKNLEKTVSIVCAFVSNNSVSSAELPRLVAATFRSLTEAAATPASDGTSGTVAMQAERTVFDDYLICLEDGKRFRLLKRHLWARFGLSPDAYRRKWGLPETYPMSAPAFSRRRSETAKARQLGKHARAGEHRRNA